MTKILFGVTSENTAHAFLDGHLHELASAGCQVHLLCGDGQGSLLQELADRNQTTLHTIPLSRQPAPLRDLKALLAVYRIVRSVAPNIVSAGTPKMSMLLLVASWCARVPRRVYIVHGLRHEGMSGWRKKSQQLLEFMLCKVATDTAAVSESVRHGLSAIGVPKKAIDVVGHGSPDGVDKEFFQLPTPANLDLFRAHYAIDPTRPTIGFAARLTHDKGIGVMADAARNLPYVQFLLAGRPEPANQEDVRILQRLNDSPNVILVGRLDDMRPLYAVSDVFALPTRREGLPTVILEASASGTPTVAMDATGTRDLVQDESNGRLVAQGDTAAFIDALRDLVDNTDKRRRFGQCARAFVAARYDQNTVRRDWRHYYLESRAVSKRNTISPKSRPRNVEDS
ncbi:glycosyltransferase family 4 protein [Serinicoccus kebangsaanensis]|uniref:glycosyltransferase family 4 protein n=1 Tax=Serinicoccus kebangsaanensis TaxID=2602069 RepID=UPI00124C2712|nr:glycosyltransferase family 4 protein [Serinicoccus kebangsaanensis]